MSSTASPAVATTRRTGFVEAWPRLLLRLEGAAAFAAALGAYAATGANWWLFLLFLAPDLSFIAYLRGSAIGAAAYNALHTYVAAILLGFAGLALHQPLVMALAAIWVAHIGFDRALGYGLKYPDSFNATHLGPTGRKAAGK